MIFLKLKKQNKKGFTILETLVAITIILIAVTGPLDIIAHSLKASYYSRDEVTAFYLAQEAIEYARNKRDNNELDPNTAVDDWLKGVTDNSDINSMVDCLNDANETSPKKCSLVQDSAGLYSYEQCPSGQCHIPMKKSATGIYGVDPAVGIDDTNFTREIYFTKVLYGDGTDHAGQSRNEIQMTVNIYWSNNFSQTNKFSITTHLLNWKITN